MSKDKLWLQSPALLVGMQNQLFSGSRFDILPCPEHRIVLHIEPRVNHIVVVPAKGVTALTGGMNGDAL